MVPDISHPVWMQIVTGRKPIQSSKATVNLMIHNNKSSYERDSSPENVKQMIAKTHKFFSQFEAIFPGEVNQISQ
jgi:hypothetical protein